MTETVAFSARARGKARRSAVQALYQWLITDSPLIDIHNEFKNERRELQKADQEYFKQLINGVGKYQDELEEMMRADLDRSIDQLDPVERAILLLSSYELKYELQTPKRVVINESVELAKLFGAEQSYKYINGIIDKLATRLRVHESGNPADA